MSKQLAGRHSLKQFSKAVVLLVIILFFLLRVQCESIHRACCSCVIGANRTRRSLAQTSAVLCLIRECRGVCSLQSSGPQPSWHRNQFHGRPFFQEPGVGRMVWGWFKRITFIAHFASNPMLLFI